MENNDLKAFVLDTLQLMAAVGETELTIRKTALQFINSRILENTDIALINSFISNRANKK